MLLCFNSIKVKVFYALECWNTASPEKKLSEKDGDRGLKWARVGLLSIVHGPRPVCSQSVSSLVVASDESTRQRRQRQSRVRRRRRARRAGSHGDCRSCAARLPQIAASPPRRVDHLHCTLGGCKSAHKFPRSSYHQMTGCHARTYEHGDAQVPRQIFSH